MAASAQFDIVSPTFHAAPFATLERLRLTGPLVRMKVPIFGRAWLATTHEACSLILKDQATFARDPARPGRRVERIVIRLLPRTLGIAADNMLAHDDPEHRRLRGLVDHAFQRRDVASMRPQIETIADRLLDRLGLQGEVDLLAGYCRELPLLVICRLLGLRAEDHDQFRSWLGGLGDTASLAAIARAFPGVFRAVRYIRHAVRGQIPVEPDGLFSALLQGDMDGQRLSEDEQIAMIFLLFGAGHETTTHLITGGILNILGDERARQRLVDDPAGMPLAVEECLRHVSPVQATKPRYATRDVDVFGVRIGRGDTVIPFLAAANVDPAKFGQPERFDVARQPNAHLAFGTGAHFCLGFQLARLEAAIALERLFARFPRIRLAVPADGILWRSRFGLRAMASLPVRLAA